MTCAVVVFGCAVEIVECVVGGVVFFDAIFGVFRGVTVDGVPLIRTSAPGQSFAKSSKHIEEGPKKIRFFKVQVIKFKYHL